MARLFERIEKVPSFGYHFSTLLFLSLFTRFGYWITTTNAEE